MSALSYSHEDAHFQFTVTKLKLISMFHSSCRRMSKSKVDLQGKSTVF